MLWSIHLHCTDENLRTTEKLYNKLQKKITQQTNGRAKKRNPDASVASMFAMLPNLVEMPVIKKQNPVKCILSQCLILPNELIHSPTENLLFPSADDP